MATAVKAPSGRTIWKAVRDELMLNLYPLPFCTIAPAVYHVYLHPDDFARSKASRRAWSRRSSRR